MPRSLQVRPPEGPLALPAPVTSVALVPVPPAPRFAVPRPPATYVARPRLLAALERGADLPLTLVSAPAGSGKTTLVAGWLADGGPAAVCWLSFEEGDERPERLWPLVLESLRRGGVGVPASVGQRRDRRRLLVGLGGALARLEWPLTLVLDGFELGDAALAAELDYLVSHCGDRLRLVVLTRVDPVLPLHRYRLAGTVAEVRMAELAFTPAETEQLLELSGVHLDADGVSTLTSRTRGWAAGLRFATMLLERSDAPERTVAQLAGDNGNIAEYLMAEILQTQPEAVRELLLRTSVVDVLRPGLVEELGGRSASRSLAALARANVLVEEIRDRPGWYRYHPFLRDLLRAELGYHSPRRLKQLRSRAGAWYAAHGMVAEAVTLAVEAGGWADAAAYAVDGRGLPLLLSGDDAGGLVTALRRLPAQVPGLPAALVRAALSLADGDLDTCTVELTRARQELGPDAPVDPLTERALDLVETARMSAAAGVHATDRVPHNPPGVAPLALLPAGSTTPAPAPAPPRELPGPQSFALVPDVGSGAVLDGEGLLIERLTAKEHEVLRHLAQLLTTEEIAATMFVSVNTVRTHVRSILRKLAVSRRNEAIRRARALSLLDD